ncbi:MAG TPA: CoA ester lyase [Candidatus Dormibacteraeota bacterium]|nr:CoA ester lyase [Candidatus Dormibacteraeota bacterium]
MTIRLRRSCIAVPGSSEKMLRKAGENAAFGADQFFLDLEDAVAPGVKEAARANIVAALNEYEFGNAIRVVRVNAADHPNAYGDIISVVEGAGTRLDCLMVPKVDNVSHVHFVDRLLDQLEATLRLKNRIGLELQIETAEGLVNVNQIAGASDRTETIIFGPGDFSANIGMPQLTVGAIDDRYPGDIWHHVNMSILMAARAHGHQAIDGPYAQIRDEAGLREVAMRTYLMGFDGKWALHPDQVAALNEIYSPTLESYERAVGILEAYRKATEEDKLGAVMYGDEMIDEASRKMAEQLAIKGRAAGLDKRLAEKQAGAAPEPAPAGAVAGEQA